MTMSIWRKLSSARHGRGFGVHSPLAYDLITAVLPDTPAYYLDANIKTMFHGRRRQRIARVILRLVSRFEPKTVCVPDNFEPLLKLIDSDIVFIKDPRHSDFTVWEEEDRVTIRVGQPGINTGPLVLDNEKDLKIEVFRTGLSSVFINTVL